MQTRHQCEPIVIANLSPLQTYHHCKPIIIANLSSLQTYHRCKAIIIANLSSLQTYRHCKSIMHANLSSMQTYDNCKPVMLYVARYEPLSDCPSPRVHFLFGHHCEWSPIIVANLSSLLQTNHQWTNQQHVMHVSSNSHIYMVLKALGGPSKVTFCRALPPPVVKPMKY